MTNKQLKKTLDRLNIKIFDMLRILDPSNTGKYMKFLVKEFRKRHKETGYSNYSPIINEDNYLDSIRKKCKNELEDRVVEYIMDIFSTNNITNLQVFHELLERNKIKEKDIQKYESFEDIEKAIVKYEEINHEDNVHEYTDIYKDDRWYIVKPLSYYSAKIYGASTKWCTSSRETPKQFYEYSKEGILLYIIDRANNKKWAVHWGIWEGKKEEMSWWDDKDSRIDSIQVDIPFGIMNEVKNHLFKEEKPNITYFTEKSLINLKKLLNLEKKSTEIREHEVLLQETHGESFDINIGGTWVTTPTVTKPEFKVDELINKTLEYNYTLDAINKGGIPQ
jgi:hypothetical protein